MNAMRIAALSGSLRAASIYTARLRRITAGARGPFAVDLVSLGDLLLFNPDLEVDLSAAVAAFRADVAAPNALIIASPEYAHGVSGVLKNALDWLVGSDGFVGKSVLFLRTSPRACHAIAAFREILATMSARIVDELPSLAAVNHLSNKGIFNGARN